MMTTTDPPFSTPSAQQTTTTTALPYPALYLYPLNDSFVPKHIALSHGQHVKIGRQTNSKTALGERSRYFDSKVLTRQHAEVREEGGKIYVKEVKSSNGMFINSEELSSEAVESAPMSSTATPLPTASGARILSACPARFDCTCSSTMTPVFAGGGGWSGAGEGGDISCAGRTADPDAQTDGDETTTTTDYDRYG
ncbi:hypothetical protein DFP72DRAFT_1080281 [Ephemerocybe angulata]|uniref:FHA domain-containing protein n=1 Tax=Ephemerocybe angulata TaxID=980116 RepID=A0A8H6HBZ8_9AGAR|nr:hypothetical protein DFP72DRAFT_1080281 [Tulosesus angulatus]